jgi:hypothetical protein
MGLEIVQELFYTVAYEDADGMAAMKRFRSKANATIYSKMAVEYYTIIDSLRKMQERADQLDSDMKIIERSDRSNEMKVQNIVVGEVQCFSK